MKQLLFCLLFVFISGFSYSQNFKVSGTLIDSETREPLESATVYMETVKDSTLITYTITDRNGKFTLEGRTAVERARVNISFVGYEDYHNVVELDPLVRDIGEIPMPISVSALQEVVIRSRAPVTIKKDTLEFNVASFKTKKDATVEDLLKELPGVEVDPDGTIKINGKEVSNVLVNGKPFFGDDPTIATRNLTKELIEKVQVVDTKSKAEAFTGEKGSETSKTINLTIKKENNRGVFGRLAAGVGTDGRFEYAGLLNYFSNDRRLSVLGGGNNINSPGFSFGEIREMFGGSVRSVSGGGRGGYGEGIVNSRVAGTSYADVIKKNIDVATDYVYSGSNSQNETKTQRENILPNRHYFTDSENSSKNETDSHTVNMGFDIKVDSTFLINIKPSFSYSEAKGERQRSSSSFNSERELTNAATSEGYNESYNRRFRNRIDLTKKYGSRGGFVRVNFNNDWNTTTGEDFSYSTTHIYGDRPSDEIRDQYSDSERNSVSYSARATYRLPLLSQKLYLDLNYTHYYSKSENNKSVFDFDAANQDYSDFNTILSTEYVLTDIRSTPRASLIYQTDKGTIDVGAGYVFRKLLGKDGLRPELHVDSKFQDMEVDVRGSYNFSSSSGVYFGYSLFNETPNVSQLEPNTDVSDPLNSTTGNPDLKPSTNHNIYFNYNDFDFQKGFGIYAFLGADFSENSIVRKTTVDENNVRYTTYANVDGGYSLRGNVNLMRTLKKDSLRNIRVSIGVRANTSQDINFNNGVEYKSDNLGIGPSTQFYFVWNNLFEIQTSYQLSYSKSTFEKNIFKDREYMRHAMRMSTALFVPKNFEWRNEITFNYNPDIAQGFQKSAWFWNSTLSYTIMKDNGILSLKVYDLLNQNSNAQRTSSEDFIQDRQSTVLQQYFMLGFSYKFNTLGSYGEMDQNRRGGGMRGGRGRY